jgi:hypothetical protein
VLGAAHTRVPTNSASSTVVAGRAPRLARGSRPGRRVADAAVDGSGRLRAVARPWRGVVAKDVRAPYRPGMRTGMVKVKRIRTIDAVVVGYRPGKEEGTVRSLILGLYDEAGVLHVVGYSSGLKAAEKRALVHRSPRTRPASGAAVIRAAGRASVSWSGSRCGRSWSWRYLRPLQRGPDPPRDEDPPLAGGQGPDGVPALADGSVIGRSGSRPR